MFCLDGRHSKKNGLKVKNKKSKKQERKDKYIQSRCNIEVVLTRHKVAQKVFFQSWHEAELQHTLRLTERGRNSRADPDSEGVAAFAKDEKKTMGGGGERVSDVRKKLRKEKPPEQIHKTFLKTKDDKMQTVQQQKRRLSISGLIFFPSTFMPG